MIRTVLLGMGVLAVAGAAYVRLAPSDPARWHVSVADAPDPGAGGVKLLTDAFEEAPEALLARFAATAEEAGATVLAGGPDEGRVTYIARTRTMGFPDYITAEAVPEGSGARLHILSRLRFGQSDLGVNQRRLGEWLGRL